MKNKYNLWLCGTNPFVITLCIIALVWARSGRSQISPSVQQTQPPSASNIWTEQMVSNILIVGKSQSEIDKVFGHPFASDATSKDTTEATYFFAPLAGVREWRYHFAGFLAYFKDGALVDWSPTYSSQTLGSPANRDTRSGNLTMGNIATNALALSHTISMYILPDNYQDEQDNDGVVLTKILDSRRPDFISSISHAFYTTNSITNDGRVTIEYTASINLKGANSHLFANFSRKNCGKFVFVAFDGRPIVNNIALIPVDSEFINIISRKPILDKQWLAFTCNQ